MRLGVRFTELLVSREWCWLESAEPARVRWCHLDGAGFQEPTCSTSSIVVEGQMGASLHTHSRGWGLGQGWVRAQQQPPGCSAGERHWKRSISRSPRFVTHNKSQIRTTTHRSAFKPNKRRKQKQVRNNFNWAGIRLTTAKKKSK